MHPKFFPTLLMVLDFCAAIVWLCNGDSRKAVYWACAGILTWSVTF